MGRRGFLREALRGEEEGAEASASTGGDGRDARVRAGVVPLRRGGPRVPSRLRAAHDGLVEGVHRDARRVAGESRRYAGSPAPALRAVPDARRPARAPMVGEDVAGRPAAAPCGSEMRALAVWRERRQKKALDRRRESLRTYYKTAELWLPPRPTFRQFRVAIARGDGRVVFRKIEDRVRGVETLRRWLLRLAPDHVYFTTSRWLDPQRLGPREFR